MRIRKHKKDTKANTHRDRWQRAIDGGFWHRFKHSNQSIEGRLKKQKLIIKIIQREKYESYKN